MTREPIDIVNKLRMYAEDLHSAGGFNRYSAAMSLAADEIVRLRDYAEMMEKDMIATLDQRDEIEKLREKVSELEFSWR
jgi:hypothetical protein